MWHTQMTPSSEPRIMPRLHTPSRFLARPQLLTRL
jgi:hypothetical protein